MVKIFSFLLFFIISFKIYAIDTKAEQTLLSKTLVNLKLAADAEVATKYAIFNTSALTANRTITVPDLAITLVGTDATQVLQNKSVETLILQDPTTTTKKITFSVANQNSLSNETFQFPLTNSLNNSGGTNTLITALSSNDLYNKTHYAPVFKQTGNIIGQATIDVSNLSGPRTIKFPDADATLLSTSNVTLDDVTFGAGIGAANLTGRTRQQQFFFAGS